MQNSTDVKVMKQTSFHSVKDIPKIRKQERREQDFFTVDSSAVINAGLNLFGIV